MTIKQSNIRSPAFSVDPENLFLSNCSASVNRVFDTHRLHLNGQLNTLVASCTQNNNEIKVKLENIYLLSVALAILPSVYSGNRCALAICRRALSQGLK